MSSFTSRFTRTLTVASLLAVAGAGAVSPAFSAAIGTGAGQMAGGGTPAVTQVGCWNCNNGAAVGLGIAAGILGGAAIAGALTPPPPVVYAPGPVYVPAPAYAPPPPPYAAPAYYPPPGYYPPPPPRPYYRPGRCWYETDGRGYGYWGPC